MVVGEGGLSGGNLYVLMRGLWTSGYRQNCLMEIAQGTAWAVTAGDLGQVASFP